MAIIISIGKWGGVYAFKGYGLRICLGWVAITFFPTDADNIIDFASKWAAHLTSTQPNALISSIEKSWDTPEEDEAWKDL